MKKNDPIKQFEAQVALTYLRDQLLATKPQLLSLTAEQLMAVDEEKLGELCAREVDEETAKLVRAEVHRRLMGRSLDDILGFNYSVAEESIAGDVVDEVASCLIPNLGLSFPQLKELQGRTGFLYATSKTVSHFLKRRALSFAVSELSRLGSKGCVLISLSEIETLLLALSLADRCPTEADGYPKVLELVLGRYLHQGKSHDVDFASPKQAPVVPWADFVSLVGAWESFSRSPVSYGKPNTCLGLSFREGLKGCCQLYLDQVKSLSDVPDWFLGFAQASNLDSMSQTPVLLRPIILDKLGEILPPKLPETCHLGFQGGYDPGEGGVLI